MYADREVGRYMGARRFDPRSLGVAVAINGAVLAALMLASPDIVHKVFDPPLTIYPVAPETPTPPEPQPPKPSPLPRATVPEHVAAPIPTVPVLTEPFLPYTDPAPMPAPTGASGGMPGGTGSAPAETPIPPVLVAPRLDARYADDLQPAYPPEERRALREGRVVARVFVGVTGRVQRIERVDATSDAFWRVTQAQSARWRFRPATRDGIPVEAWYRVSLRFELKE